MPAPRIPPTPRSRTPRRGWAILVLAGLLAAPAMLAVADPTVSGGWLVFIAQQSLRSRNNALVALAILGLAGGVIVAVTLLASDLMARRSDLDPAQGGPPRESVSSAQDRRRSRSAALVDRSLK